MCELDYKATSDNNPCITAACAQRLTLRYFYRMLARWTFFCCTFYVSFERVTCTTIKYKKIFRKNQCLTRLSWHPPIWFRKFGKDQPSIFWDNWSSKGPLKGEVTSAKQFARLAINRSGGQNNQVQRTRCSVYHLTHNATRWRSSGLVCKQWYR